MDKLSPWFGGFERPERIGVYQRISHFGIINPFSYWDGRYWYFNAVNPEFALRNYNSQEWQSSFQTNNWRGIVK